jgi:flagellar protein FliS
MMTMNSPAASYARVGVETGVMGASRHQLVLMLFNGAQLAVTMAVSHLDAGNVPEKGSAITRAIDIISNGLRASLDLNAGGDLAQRLDSLYEYMSARLLYANIRNDAAALKEVSGLLGELKEAWEEIADDPTVLSANKAAA